VSSAAVLMCCSGSESNLRSLIDDNPPGSTVDGMVHRPRMYSAAADTGRAAGREGSMSRFKFLPGVIAVAGLLVSCSAGDEETVRDFSDFPVVSADPVVGVDTPSTTLSEVAQDADIEGPQNFVDQFSSALAQTSGNVGSAAFALMAVVDKELISVPSWPDPVTLQRITEIESAASIHPGVTKAQLNFEEGVMCVTLPGEVTEAEFVEGPCELLDTYVAVVVPAGSVWETVAALPSSTVVSDETLPGGSDDSSAAPPSTSDSEGGSETVSTAPSEEASILQVSVVEPVKDPLFEGDRQILSAFGVGAQLSDSFEVGVNAAVYGSYEISSPADVELLLLNAATGELRHSELFAANSFAEYRVPVNIPAGIYKFEIIGPPNVRWSFNLNERRVLRTKGQWDSPGVGSFFTVDSLTTPQTQFSAQPSGRIVATAPATLTLIDAAGVETPLVVNLDGTWSAPLVVPPVTPPTTQPLPPLPQTPPTTQPAPMWPAGVYSLRIETDRYIELFVGE
jgi:hypothetical protein